MLTTEPQREADRLLTICNACRYCEGLCAVYPAMEMRRTFAAGDLHYIANLCHQCGACLPDCQYAPPHQFEVNVPAALARLRNESYAAYAWPRAFAGAFHRNGPVIAFITAVSIALFVLGFVMVEEPNALFEAHGGDFYRLMPHTAMITLFGAAALFAAATLCVSLWHFWRDIHAQGPRIGVVALMQALYETLTLRYLGGGGGGCMSENERPSATRRIFHHLTFYGFFFCFAATCVATLYHYGFGWHAPYAFTSLPVLLGMIGGAGLLIGPGGLFVLARARARELTDPAHLDMDTAFVVMLFLTSLSGLLLMALRDTGALGLLLAVHLGLVFALFVTLPYGKFVHGLYRFLALLQYAAERRRGEFVE